MRKIGRHRRKKQKKILIIGSLSLLLFLCVGYAAFSTELSLKAKGNIVKKYIDITNNLVTDGDGLYKDVYEDGAYVYRGSNPNNYIYFNNELWRIISVEGDGTYKIIRNEVLGNMPFDEAGRRTTGYCGDNLDGFAIGGMSDLHGCNVWVANSELVGQPDNFINGDIYGIIERNSSLHDYLNYNYLISEINDEFFDIIVPYNYGVGSLNFSTDLRILINDENKYIWNGVVGLLNFSDFVNANSNINECIIDGIVDGNDEMCITTNWLYLDYEYWMITPLFDYNYHVFTMNNQSFFDTSSPYSDKIFVRPVLHLSSDIKIINGDGSEKNPFQIELD